MDAAQLQQLIAAASRKSRRPEIYSSGCPLEWQTWRRNTTRIITLNNWNDAANLPRAKNEIRVSITGNADITAADIQPVDGETVENLLDRLQARFCPAAQSQYARVAFDQCVQSPNEDILAFHSRLRALFTRAHPALAGDLENNHVLIRKFILALIDADVKQWTLSADPATFAVALETAQNRAAVGAVLSSHVGRGGKLSAMEGINAVYDGTRTPSTAGANAALRRGGLSAATMAPGNANQNGNCCWTCGSPSHLMRSCPKAPAEGAGQGGGRGRGGFNRGRGWGRGGGRGRGRGGRGAGRGGRGGRALNAIGKEEEEAEGDDEYVDAISAVAQQVEDAMNIQDRDADSD